VGTITTNIGTQISSHTEPRLQTGMANPSTESFWALVLAGGDSTRLQGVTRIIAGASIPKQYCRIFGSRSLLEATLRRIAPLVAAERTLVIINRDHLTIARPQLTSLDVRNVLVQPRNLDTGPGLLLSMLELSRRDPEATVAIFPSDHYVRDGAAFRRSIERMGRVVAAHAEKIALLGAHPEQVDTGYSYIAPGRPVAPGVDAFVVLAFHEKPTPGLAGAIIGRGALWNSFVMVAARRGCSSCYARSARTTLRCSRTCRSTCRPSTRCTTACSRGTSRVDSSHAYPSTWSSHVPTTSAGAIGVRPRRSSDRSRQWASFRRGRRASKPSVLRQ
jgi:mannose-1-phosphate guanylyltransferase